MALETCTVWAKLTDPAFSLANAARGVMAADDGLEVPSDASSLARKVDSTASFCVRTARTHTVHGPVAAMAHSASEVPRSSYAFDALTLASTKSLGRGESAAVAFTTIAVVAVTAGSLLPRP